MRVPLQHFRLGALIIVDMVPQVFQENPGPLTPPNGMMKVMAPEVNFIT